MITSEYADALLQQILNKQATPQTFAGLAQALHEAPQQVITALNDRDPQQCELLFEVCRQQYPLGMVMLDYLLAHSDQLEGRNLRRALYTVTAAVAAEQAERWRQSSKDLDGRWAADRDVVARLYLAKQYHAETWARYEQSRELTEQIDRLLQEKQRWSEAIEHSKTTNPEQLKQDVDRLHQEYERVEEERQLLHQERQQITNQLERTRRKVREDWLEYFDVLSDTAIQRLQNLPSLPEPLTEQQRELQQERENLQVLLQHEEQEGLHQQICRIFGELDRLQKLLIENELAERLNQLIDRWNSAVPMGGKSLR